MCDPNWILAANPHFPESIVSKIRAVLSVETSSRSTHFFGAVERRSKGYPMPLQTTLGFVRDATQRRRRNTTPGVSWAYCDAGASALTSGFVRGGRPDPRGHRPEARRAAPAPQTNRAVLVATVDLTIAKRITMDTIEHLCAPILESSSRNAEIGAPDDQNNAIAVRPAGAGTSFSWAMHLLSVRRRKAVYARYDFCA